MALNKTLSRPELLIGVEHDDIEFGKASST